MEICLVPYAVLSIKINQGVKMNLSNKTKKKWSLLFLFLIFFSFIFS
ncbi:hypothetical protein QF80_004673, partial [Salmonella enterica subsp. salamae]|nr:hypothetical protein [Salmonella enterica subsp. salamae]